MIKEADKSNKGRYIYTTRNGETHILYPFYTIWCGEIDENNNYHLTNKVLHYMCTRCNNANYKNQLRENKTNKRIMIPMLGKRKAIYKCIFCGNWCYKTTK